MNSHVASRGSPLTWAFQQAGHALIVPIKFFLACSFFISGHLISQFAKVILFWSFYCYNFYHDDIHRTLFNQAFR